MPTALAGREPWSPGANLRRMSRITFAGLWRARRRIVHATRILLLAAWSCAAPQPASAPMATSASSPESSRSTAATPRPAVPPPTAVAEAPPPLAETNVRPGANQEYLLPDMEVSEWVQRFERGGRDIYDNREALLRAAGAGPGLRIADIGAGTGLFTMLFARAVGPSGHVYAVDIAPKFIEHLQTRVAAERLTNVSTLLGTDKFTSLPKGRVDVAFVCDVYHHFEYPRHMLASIRQALRPGGTLLVIDFKRVRGQSPAWVLEHVRAGGEVFTAEIQAAGFEKVESIPALKENYVLKFRKK